MPSVAWKSFHPGFTCERLKKPAFGGLFLLMVTERGEVGLQSVVNVLTVDVTAAPPTDDETWK